MTRLYADEQFPFPVVEFLRLLGHDILIVQAAGKAGQKSPLQKYWLLRLKKIELLLL